MPKKPAPATPPPQPRHRRPRQEQTDRTDTGAKQRKPIPTGANGFAIAGFVLCLAATYAANYAIQYDAATITPSPSQP